MKILIVGGTRFVGPILVDLLAQAGNEVTLFNRGQEQKSFSEDVHVIKGDRDNGFRIKKHFDVVVDMCAYNGNQTKIALEQLSCDLFLHFGTIASYRKSELFPLTEESSIDSWPTMSEYSKGKIECEQVLAASDRKYATIRPCYILGANNYLERELFIYKRIYNGEELVLPGNGQALCQFVFVQDVAAIIAMIIEKQLTGAFGCSGDEIITLKGIVELMGEIVGKEPIIKYNQQADGENFNRNEFPFANENWISSNKKLKDLGFKFTPLVRGLKADYDTFYKDKLA